MPKALITLENVAEAADALTQAGSEPSIVNVQARLGAGSYTTVKRYLDTWKQQRAAQPSAAVSMPPEIEARAQEALRTLWTAASGLAQQETQSVKEQAHAEVTQARQELSEALGEITRLEQAEADLTRRLDEERAKAHELELANASLKTQAERATRLETELETLRREAFGASDLRIALAELQKQVTALAGASQPTLLQAESKGKATRKQSSS